MPENDPNIPTPNSEPPWTPAEMTEREEVEVRQMATKIAEAVGTDAFYDAVLQMNLKMEGVLRATCPPNHPALKMIDKYRAEREADAWKNA